MAITQITTSFAGQDGVEPQITRIVTTDTYATITTAGYLDNVIKQGFIINAGDVLLINYNNGTLGFFTISFSNGVSTLAPLTSSGEVILPVVSGHFANFSGTTGTIADSGYSPTNAAKTKVVMANAAVTANHIAQFSDTAGTIQDGGVLGTAAAKAASDNAKASLASVNGATIASNLAVFSDTAGTVQDAGARIIANTTAVFAGGGTSNTFAATGLTVNAKGSAVIRASTNSVSITKALPGTDTLDITFSADPGADTTVDYIYVTAAQS